MTDLIVSCFPSVSEQRFALYRLDDCDRTHIDSTLDADTLSGSTTDSKGLVAPEPPVQQVHTTIGSDSNIRQLEATGGEAMASSSKRDRSTSATIHNADVGGSQRKKRSRSSSASHDEPEVSWR